MSRAGSLTLPPQLLVPNKVRLDRLPAPVLDDDPDAVGRAHWNHDPRVSEGLDDAGADRSPERPAVAEVVSKRGVGRMRREGRALGCRVRVRVVPRLGQARPLGAGRGQAYELEVDRG